MLILKTLRDPVVEDFTDAGFPGVKVTLRRLLHAEIEEAQAAAAKVVRLLSDGEAALAPYGLDGRDSAGQRMNAADPAQMFRLGVTVAAVEQALRAFAAWEGVALADGSPAPINRATLTVAMLDNRFCRRALSAMEQAARLLEVEKKASPPSPDGSLAAATAGASPIADAAA
jgi:hypothetical protein